MIREYQAQDYSDIVEIFWLTSAKKEFKDADEKEQFQRKYLDYYLEHSHFIGQVFIDEDLHKVVGYIIGVSHYHESELSEHLLLKNFIKEIKSFPSELHINFHPDFQGGGRGSQLIHAFEQACVNKKSKGIFLLTAKGARNIGFYHKNNYLSICEKNLFGSDIVFMGKSIK